MDKFPFAVRLAGFPREAAQALETTLRAAPAHGPQYFCLSEHSLQEPDLVLAYGPDLKAMAELSAQADVPGELDLRPALVLGQPAAPLPYPGLPLAFDPGAFHIQLALLVARRADALARLAGEGLPPIPERRRMPRLDFDLTDPAEYEAMRGKSRRGAVLVVDGGGRLAAQASQLMKPYRITVLAASDEASALAAGAEAPLSVVLINTSLPGIDAYRVSAALRAQADAQPPEVVLVVAPPFKYDGKRGRAAGVAGLLDKPVADATLRTVLKRQMHIA
ncbi:hypothetical protein GCM10027277_17410 [Pseudoduganella ginsengisoli]|uniref:Response regulator n=1 Tax=Pseudoduganella ginsengisoli TaxID=1462440 RepID=A0A6L6PVG7_9BURK|nr:response regulator [Pseudoduganella ginsengisoli]MTW00998.1 response regulator [Pseudoduganella ginsengisoli]